MSAVLKPNEVKELEEIRKRLFERLNDWWESEVFLGDTKTLKRFTGNLNRFFANEVKRVRKKQNG